MRTILVANRKGGVGKTVTAVTIATALAGRGAAVALADADGQKSALRWLRQRPETVRPVTGAIALKRKVGPVAGGWGAAWLCSGFADSAGGRLD